MTTPTRLASGDSRLVRVVCCRPEPGSRCGRRRCRESATGVQESSLTVHRICVTLVRLGLKALVDDAARRRLAALHGKLPEIEVAPRRRPVRDGAR